MRQCGLLFRFVTLHDRFPNSGSFMRGGPQSWATTGCRGSSPMRVVSMMCPPLEDLAVMHVGRVEAHGISPWTCRAAASSARGAGKARTDDDRIRFGHRHGPPPLRAAGRARPPRPAAHSPGRFERLPDERFPGWADRRASRPRMNARIPGDGDPPGQVASRPVPDNGNSRPAPSLAFPRPAIRYLGLGPDRRARAAPGLERILLRYAYVGVTSIQGQRPVLTSFIS